MTSPGILKRLLILIYDAFIVFAIVLVAAAVTALIPDRWEFTVIVRIVKSILFLCSIYLYFGWCWTHGGQTIGMRAWRLYLVDANGKFIDWKKVNLRFAYATLSLFACGLGWFWIIVNPKNRAWHDSLSASYIVTR